MSASARQPVRSVPAISAFIPLLKPGRRFLSHFTDAPRGDWDCPTAAALSRLESGSLPGHPWQLIRARLELETVPVGSSPAVEALGVEVREAFLRLPAVPPSCS